MSVCAFKSLFGSTGRKMALTASVFLSAMHCELALHRELALHHELVLQARAVQLDILGSGSHQHTARGVLVEYELSLLEYSKFFLYYRTLYLTV